MNDRSPRWRNRPPKGPRRKAIVANDNGAYNDREGKFIGGGERARRNARKRQFSRGDVGPNRKNKFAPGHSALHSRSSGASINVEWLPRSWKSMDRFFASLFLSSVENIVNSNDSDSARTQLMSDVCGRLGLPLPAPIPATSTDSNHFYSTRASLVMEETRCIIADALRRKHRPSKPTLSLRLVVVEEKAKLGATILTFEKEGEGDTFFPQELRDMRPGCCFELVVGDKEENTASPRLKSILANVVPTADRQSIERQLSLMVYQKLNLDENLAKEELWEVRPLVTVISEARQFEACTRAANVSFLPKLLGWKDASHIRFDDSDNYSTGSNDRTGSDEELNDTENSGSDNDGQVFDQSNIILPQLNPTQARAASAYLASPSSTLTLIQGPPGSGKTTFTVSCIIQCLFQRSERRLLVTAPTNKAISVLASRFLSALNGDDSVKVVMIGVEDKLIGDDDDHAPRPTDCCDDLTLPSTLRDIFVYSWIDTIIDQFQDMIKSLRSNRNNIRGVASMLNGLCANGNNISGVVTKVRHLRKKLRSRLPSTFRASEAADSLDALIHTLEETNDCHEISLSNVISGLRRLEQSAVTQELLVTADVIFSTLSTAGIAAMKQTRKITDLIVDEAAAATEPEMLIPLHLSPDRMLVVGDPKQLPATIMSKNAAAWGLDRSLHQRLMYECGKGHIMLDTQYRMKPCITAFPSREFYENKLMNGENVKQSTYGKDASILFPGDPFIFFQINGSERQSALGSYCNKREGLFVVECLKKLREMATTKKYTTDATGSAATPWYSPDRIRVITFYQAQVCLIQKLLQKNGLGKVLVSTVDSCQGCEADVVILSFVRSNDKKGSVKHTAGFLCDERRLNVSLTRAKYQLICIGDASGTLSASDGSILSKLVNEARTRKCIKSIEEDCI